MDYSWIGNRRAGQTSLETWKNTLQKMKHGLFTLQCYSFLAELVIISLASSELYDIDDNQGSID